MTDNNVTSDISPEKHTPNQPLTKEQIITAIRDCAEKLGRTPGVMELRASTGIKPRSIRRHFMNYTRALQQCGLERGGSGYKTPLSALFKDWAGLVRTLGRVPKMVEYEMQSKYSSKPLVTLYGSWGQVPFGLFTLAEEKGWEGGWEDVLEVVKAHLQENNAQTKTSWTPNSPPNKRIFRDRPIYGPPVIAVPLAHGPVNEAGVVFLFGMMALQLGFVVTRVQTEFPDCEAMWEVQPGVWQRVRIEFEYESRNFVKHLHNAEECDLIVCWINNWEQCPLQVVELRKQIAKIAMNATIAEI
ncbi:MAG TPA: hypothetical protein VGK22_15315 [Candidatus Angelobacter sp.]